MDDTISEDANLAILLNTGIFKRVTGIADGSKSGKKSGIGFDIVKKVYQRQKLWE